MANSVDPDETPHSAASHLGLYCLLRPVCPNTYSKYGMCFCWEIWKNNISGCGSISVSTMEYVLLRSNEYCICTVFDVLRGMPLLREEATLSKLFYLPSEKVPKKEEFTPKSPFQKETGL